MYRLFGNLFLESPPPGRQSELEKLEPHLRDLENRVSPHVDLDAVQRKLSAFRIEETQAWSAYEEFSERDPEYIVVPSGSWNARLAHHLHNPSFTSLNLKNGKTGDPTNPCTSMILDNNFDDETHFIFDHFQRRESFSPFDEYPEAIKKLHFDLADWIRETLNAKIHIIYGAYVRKWANKHLELTAFRLWGTYSDIWLNLEWARDEHPKRLLRILLFALHPQRVMGYPSRTEIDTRNQDMIVKCAYELAGLSSIVNYYQKKPWSSKADFLHNATIKKLGEAERDQSNILLGLLREKSTDQSARSTLVSETVKVFPKETTMSIQRLYEVLAKILKGTQIKERKFQAKYESMVIDDANFLPSLLPLIREWVEKSSHFFQRPVEKPDDLMPAYQRHCADMAKKGPSPPETSKIILRLLTFQQVTMNSRIRGNIKTMANMGERFSTFEVTPLKCDACGTAFDDDQFPIFREDGVYMARRVQCHSETCAGTKVNAIPADDIDFQTRTAHPNPTNDWKRLIRRANDCQDLRKTVELWCCYCREKTEVRAAFGTTRATVLDANPRYTLGERPKYVPRKSWCIPCGSKKEQKFVPLDPSINFINKRTLNNLAQRFPNMDAESLSCILDTMESATHAPRKLKEKREERAQKAASRFPRQLRVTNPEKPDIVHLKCSVCGADCGVNVEPKYHVDTGDYIAVRRRDCPQKCGGKWIYLVPRDDALPWIKTTVVENQQRKEAELAAKSAPSDPEEDAPSDSEQDDALDSEVEIVVDS